MKEADWTEISYRFISKEKKVGPLVGLNVDGSIALKPDQRYKWDKIETWIWTSLIIEDILGLKTKKQFQKCLTLDDF